MRTLIQKQPWTFLYYAIAFGVLNYFLTSHDVAWSTISGLGFATLMSITAPWWSRRKKKPRTSRWER